MVVAKDGDKLYKNTKAIIQLHLEKMVFERIVPALPPFLLQSSGSGLDVGSSAKETPASNDELELFLRAFNNVWKDHLIISNMIKDVLMYLVSISLDAYFILTLCRIALSYLLATCLPYLIPA